MCAETHKEPRGRGPASRPGSHWRKRDAESSKPCDEAMGSFVSKVFGVVKGVGDRLVGDRLPSEERGGVVGFVCFSGCSDKL